jgi:3-deoxy-manno-octulosonate cytidylyltransferase (CMP-KDO synthetase)
MKIIGIIPARFASTRFPGKPLIDIGGKSMIQRVYEQAAKVSELSAIAVATDDERIFNHVRSFGGNVLMTSPDHPSGTDRCLEAATLWGKEYDFLLNIQGDEPFIQPSQLAQLAALCKEGTEVATLVRKIVDRETLFNPNAPKVVLDTAGNALYFSRSPIPFVRGKADEDWLNEGPFYRHIGLYAYAKSTLAHITRLSPSSLEIREALEQLRWLEHGITIKTGQSEYDSIGIDVPEDLEKIRAAGLI